MRIRPNIVRNALTATGAENRLCVVLWFSCLAGTSTFAFSLADCQAARSFITRVSLTNVPIVITATITNGGTNILRGLYYADQIPSALAVTTVRLSLGGTVLTNFVVETGQDGDVYPGCTPWRWRFETPTNFVEANPLAPGTLAQLVYTISSTSTGLFQLQQFEWVASAPDKTNVVFGFGESLDERTVKFDGSTNAPLLVGRFSSSGYSLSLDGVPRWPYLVSYSANLHDWSPLVTNVSPFSFKDALSAGRFYAATPYTDSLAGLSFLPLSNNAWSVLVGGVSNCYYVLQKSPDLINWSPITTNLSPYSFLHTNSAGQASTYYRATIALEP